MSIVIRIKFYPFFIV